MASDDLDRVEVDRLVIELAHPPKPPAPKVKSAFAALAAEPAAPITPASVSAPGRSWTTAHVLMPANRTVRRKRFAFTLPAFTFHQFHQLRRVALQKIRATQWSTFSVRIYVGLGVLLCAAMPYWPYAHAWSWGLLLYLSAVELVVVTGIWGAKLTWDAELPGAHTVAVGTVIWGLGLLVWETAPRIAYA
jgi:hypothetical protein